MAFCDHDWWDMTTLWSSERELICRKCGRIERNPSAPYSSMTPNWRSSAGVEMRLAKEGSGAGDPYRWSMTRRPSPVKVAEYVAEYGCGCTWEINEQTLMMSAASGPTHGVELCCPIHRGKTAMGYALGSAAPVGGSLSISLSSPQTPMYAPPQPVPPKELELTFETEPIVGWRMWRVVTHHLHGGISEPRLQPLTGRNLWEPRERYTATCLPGPRAFVYAHGVNETHEAPGRHCDCGTWAVRDKADLPNVRASGDRGILCMGEAHLWGRVLEFKKGWRAKYAYPKSLTLLADDPVMASDLERLYGVPVAIGVCAS